MSWLESKYLHLLSPRLRNFKRKDDNLFNFSCNLCGDSKKNEYKARGYVYEREGSLLYRCHNCGESCSFANFLKKSDPGLFKEYRMEKFVGRGKKPKRFDVGKPPKVKEVLKKDLPFSRVSELPDTHIANLYLNKRQIPKDKRDDLYYVDQFSKLEKIYPKYQKKLPHDQRIIFPIYNRNKTIVGLAARKILKGDQLRYISLKFSEEEPLLYGIDKVNFNDTIYVFEGAMDSKFFENSLAVDGADFFKLSDVVSKDRCVVVFDNQPKNLEVIKHIKKVIDDNWRVAILPNWMREDGKDMNQLILSGYKKEDLKRIIDEHTYQGLKARNKFVQWKLLKVK